MSDGVGSDVPGLSEPGGQGASDPEELDLIDGEALDDDPEVVAGMARREALVAAENDVAEIRPAPGGRLDWL